ncbi:MAG: phospholipase D-like domain-containing protein [Pseudomonadota bacterium]
MAEQTIGVAPAGVALASDGDYADVARAFIQSAVHYCHCLLFIVDTDPADDDKLLVDGLLHELAALAWRGTDTKLLIGGSRDNTRIRDACLASRARALELGVPARLVAATSQRSVHSKILVSDTRCLLGSHNWSPGALGGQRQDSVLVDNAELAAYFASRFTERWATGKEDGFDVLD